jgi:periplasmic copper chaperone A
MTRSSVARRAIGATVAALLLLVSACGTSPGGDDGAPSEITVSDAWARTSPMVVTRGAVYMEIRNAGGTDDALVAASVDSSVAASVEIHETVAVMPTGGMGTGMGDGDASPGSEMMEMRPVERIEVPAGGSASLEPGGYHVMLLDLAAPLEEGGTISVTLTFEEAGEIEITADVRATAP